MGAMSDALPQLSADAPAFRPAGAALTARKPEQPRYVAPKRADPGEAEQARRWRAPSADPPGLAPAPRDRQPAESDSGEHRCMPCGRSFNNARALLQHREAKHTAEAQAPREAQQARLSPRSFRKDRSTGRARNATPADAPSRPAERRAREGESKPGGGRKPKNTTCFTPSHRAPDLRVLCGPPRGRYPRAHGPRDVVLVPEFFCHEGELAIYDKLLAELQASGKEEEGLWALWHGDSHVIANDRKGWKKTCPTFTKLVEQMADYFGMDVKATRLNWYRDSSEWKPFHHDRAAFTPDCQQNCTVGASFGLCRDIAFQHAKNESLVCSFPQPNGSLYTFGRDVNVEWKHGVTQLPPEQQVASGRISIIAWGYVPEE